jgi:hypothetical protein
VRLLDFITDCFHFAGQDNIVNNAEPVTVERIATPLDHLLKRRRYGIEAADLGLGQFAGEGLSVGGSCLIIKFHLQSVVLNIFSVNNV